MRETPVRDISPIRVAAYYDGCNFFNGLRVAGFRRFYWVDLLGLTTQFLAANQTLVATKYFTARVKGNPVKSARHGVYIDALRAKGGVEIIEGNYQLEPVHCGNCKAMRQVPKEKQTDTSIAAEVVADAFLDRWDTAFIVSGDSDLIPPIMSVKKHFPKKRMLVVFPPQRRSSELAQAAHGSFNINHVHLSSSQLPESIQSVNVVLSRPNYWN